MEEAYDIANRNIGKSGSYNKQKYDQKHGAVEIVVGDRVLVKNVRPQGTTRAGKLASFWEPTIHEVIYRYEGLPVYVVREWGVGGNVKTRTLHRNLLKQVNELAPLARLPSDTAPVPCNPGTDPGIPFSVPKPGHPSKVKSVKSVKKRRPTPLKSSASNSHKFEDWTSSSESDSGLDTVVVVRRKPLMLV